VNEKSQRCLNVEGGSRANGARLIQWDCVRTRNTAWSFRTVGGHAYLESDSSQLCMNVSGGSVANGAPIIQWNCDPSPNNWWYLRPA
jgi:hypothetical protein